MSHDFQQHPGYARIYAPDRMTLGLFMPIEAYSGSIPQLRNQERLAARAEDLGFSALWFRDVPLLDPSFGDAGQVFDPFVHMSWIAAHTRTIALATGAIVLPLRHPLHVAKAAASVDVLARGRLVLGVASGDRPVEFPAFGVRLEERSERLLEGLQMAARVLTDSFPEIDSRMGVLRGVDVLPKPYGGPGRLPLLMVGRGGLPLDVIAQVADGWVTYPRTPEQQRTNVLAWQDTVARICGDAFKPFSQSLYIDLAQDPGLAPTPIHLGWRLGRRALHDLLGQLQTTGVNHVILNLKYGQRAAEDVLEELGEHLVPHWPALPAPVRAAA